MLYLLIAAACCAADQLFKFWVVRHIPLEGYVELIPGFVGLTHIRNTGMAFSLLSEHTWILAVVSGAVAVLLAWLLWKGKFTGWEKLGLALVLGGDLGNLIDRAFLGYVVDMINPEFVRFAVFNLADSFIDMGAVLFCLLYILRSLREERAKKAERLKEEAHDGDADGN